MSDSALINALSGFWHRFFADLEDIDALYQGVEKLAAQFYVDMLYEVLGSAVNDTFLTRPETYRLWRITDADVRWSGSTWYVKTPVHWRSVRYLQDGVLAPKTVLDNVRDFTVYDDRVEFRADPRVLLTTAAKRTVSTQIGGFLRTTDIYGVTPGDRVSLADGRIFEVLYVNATGIAFTADRRLTGLPGSTQWAVPSRNITGRVGDLAPVYTDRISELAVWALDAQVDDRLLYRGLGNLLGPERPSTNQYRAFIAALARLYTCGPSLRRLEEGLTAAAGLPVANRDGEVVQEVTGTRVVTDFSVYDIPAAIPIKSDIAVGKVLRAFETFTDAVQILDHTTHPRWWYGISIPKSLLPWTGDVARQVTTELYENKIGPVYRGVIGDPSTSVGDPWRRNAAYDLMDRVLQYTMYGVKLDPNLNTVPGTIDTLRQLIWDTRPAHVYPYIWPTITLPETTYVDDADVSIGATQTLTETIYDDSTWRVGTGQVGQYVQNGGTVGTSGMPLVVGGGYPATNTTDDQAITDGALYINSRPT